MMLSLGACQTAAVESAGAEASAATSTAAAKPQLKSIKRGMWSFAKVIRELYGELGRKGGPRKQEVLTQIDAIDGVASQLQDFGDATGHPLMTKQIPRFRKELAFARKHVDQDKPEFTFAGSITGACTSCHDIRDCPFEPGRTCVDVPIY